MRAIIIILLSGLLFLTRVSAQPVIIVTAFEDEDLDGWTIVDGELNRWTTTGSDGFSTETVLRGAGTVRSPGYSLFGVPVCMEAEVKNIGPDELKAQAFNGKMTKDLHTFTATSEWTKETFWLEDVADNDTSVQLQFISTNSEAEFDNINQVDPSMCGGGGENSTGCQYTHCENGAPCGREDGVEYCMCPEGFTGLFCELETENSTGCQYTHCENGAPCGREDGIEYCMCPEGFTGLFCELETAPCDDHICQNGGMCYNATGVRTCVCMAGYFGPFCEYYDASMQCPVPGDKDMVFLPTCTLKETLGNLSECINHYLPYLDRSYTPDAVTSCHENITRTKQCIYRTFEGCSGTQCESAYQYGGVKLYSDISRQIYDPSSNFSMALRQVLCTLPDANGTFPSPDEPFNIGAPVCTEDIIDRLLVIMSDSETNFPFHDLSKTCEHLEKLKMSIFNVANESCNWPKILDALPYLRDATMFTKPHYWPNALQLTHLYFKEWFVPGCRPHPSSDCDGYCMNGGYCSLEFDGPFCSCNVSWGGPRCGVYDPTHVCPAIKEDDAHLLPLCPLQMTVDRSIHCFTDLAMSAFGREQYQTCQSKISPAFNCFGNFFRNCSRSLCPSIYLIPGADEVVRGIFGLFYDPNFLDMFSSYICQPPPPGGFIQYLRPLLSNLTVSIPFCQDSFIPDLVETLGYLENGILRNTDLAQACSVIHEFQMRMVGVMDQCDFSHLTTILPPGWEGLGDWIQKALVAARSMLRTYTLAICRDGTATGECPTITSSTPQCKFADVWMCHYFSYKKAFSQWVGKFMEWWGGCFSYDERNWDDWASTVGMNRGDGYGMGGFGMTGGHGKAGFIRMIQANMQCSEYDHDDCEGEMFTTTMGCTVCYRAGRRRNPQRMFATWMQEYQQYQMATRLVAKLREECAGTTMGCEDDFSSTMAPPTFPTTGWPDMSSTTWPDMSSTMWPDMSSTSSSDWGSSASTTTTPGMTTDGKAQDP